jgi:hypothetical protein
MAGSTPVELPGLEREGVTPRIGLGIRGVKDMLVRFGLTDDAWIAADD